MLTAHAHAPLLLLQATDVAELREMLDMLTLCGVTARWSALGEGEWDESPEVVLHQVGAARGACLRPCCCCSVE